MNLFKWMRENPESIPLLEEQGKEIGRLREELEKLRVENENLRSERIHAELIKKENKRLKEQLNMFAIAIEKGCKRGEYCRSCAYGVLIDFDHWEKCVCVYGECSHFIRKDERRDLPT